MRPHGAGWQIAALREFRHEDSREERWPIVEKGPELEPVLVTLAEARWVAAEARSGWCGWHFHSRAAGCCRKESFRPETSRTMGPWWVRESQTVRR